MIYEAQRVNRQQHMSHNMRFPTMWYVRLAKAQIAQSDQSLCLSLEYSMTQRQLTVHHLEFLSLKGDCTYSSESTLVKMPHCWKSHVAAHMTINSPLTTTITMSHPKDVRTLLSGFVFKQLYRDSANGAEI